MIEKIVVLLDAKGLAAAALERAAMLSENRISKWKQGTGEPSASEALRIARALSVEVESLIDNDQDFAIRSMNQEERAILSVVRALRLHPDEAIRRLSGYQAGIDPEVNIPGSHETPPDRNRDPGPPLPGQTRPKKSSR